MTATPEYAVRLTWATETGTEIRTYTRTSRPGDLTWATEQVEAGRAYQRRNNIPMDAELITRTNNSEWTPITNQAEATPETTDFDACHHGRRAALCITCNQETATGTPALIPQYAVRYTGLRAGQPAVQVAQTFDPLDRETATYLLEDKQAEQRRLGIEVDAELVVKPYARTA